MTSRHAFTNSVGQFTHDNFNGTHGIVIARDRQVDGFWIAIGVDQCDRWNLQCPRFAKGIGFTVGIDDDHCTRQFRHVPNAFKVTGDLPLLTHELGSHLL
ncbi:MAG: hypothetical protein MK097_12685 [Dechloromonas sp.]|nr:hypothetical protein [Dechloromonas sp.]